MVISIACSSETDRTIAGIVGFPARWEASQRRSPAINWKRSPGQRSHKDRLHDSGRRDRGSQLLQLLLVEASSRLEGIALYRSTGISRGFPVSAGSTR